jgi:hypothetical protein
MTSRAASSSDRGAGAPAAGAPAAAAPATAAAAIAQAAGGIRAAGAEVSADGLSSRCGDAVPEADTSAPGPVSKIHAHNMV